MDTEGHGAPGVCAGIPMLVFALGLFLARAQAAPNFLIVLADDAGYADFGFQGGGIGGDFAALTPNIDSLASGGVRFTSGYVSGPVCCPSRAGLLTGRYQSRFGMEQNIQDEYGAGLPTSEKTIADTLRAKGYRTYALGKWHLGQDLPEHHPNNRGFDEFYGFLAGARTYFQFTGAGNASKLQSNGVFLAESPAQYMTDVLGAQAGAYIDDHAANRPGTSFFMYLAFNAVHTPLEADSPRLADPRIQGITVPNRKTLAAMTIALDDAVGTVLGRLAAHGMANDTMVVFLSDNGGPEDKASLNAPNWSDNGPLREGKTLCYEGGIRVPFAVRWSAGIAPGLVGTDMHDPVIGIDLLPTFAAAAGGGLLPGQQTDGVNLLPRLTGTSPTPIQRCLFWRTAGSTGGQSAVRKGDWKLYRNDSTGVAELYDLATDIGESIDLAAAMPGKVAELEAGHADWESGMIEPLWGGGSFVVSNTNMTIAASGSGYELERVGTGYTYAVDELRDPLSLAENWTLVWTMESVTVAGYARNGFISLGDAAQVTRLIRVGLGFGTGIMSITELQNAAGASITIPSVAAGATNEFRLHYDAGPRTLTLLYGTNSVSHALTGTYDGDLLDYAGYALQSSSLTRFSPINTYLSPLAASASPTWSRMKIAKDYVPGTYDTNGNFLGGTEGMSLVSHKGKLFAGIGYWNDVYFGTGTNDPHPGPQVLVKEAHDAPWRQDLAVGADHLRIECLRSITLTTDKSGVPLDPPVTLLLAGSGELATVTPPRRATVFIRNDTNGAWTATYPGNVPSGSATTRMIFDHLDRSLPTPVHYVFCGYGGANNTLLKGGYNVTTGLIDWETAPELEGSERMLSAGECNGVLYACIGSNGIEGDDVGGVFWREDGPSPRWHFVCEWPLNSKNPDIRGFTAVPHPKGFGYDVAIVTLEAYGAVYCIDPIGGDPRNGHEVSEELDIRQFLGDEWNSGVSIGFPTLSAYNDMPELIHPGTLQPVNLIGVAVTHPEGYGTEKGNSAYYLIRHRDASYEWGRVFDPAVPLPNPDADGLRATRAVRLSPFPEDSGRVLYFSGFDAASQTGPRYHNTAWIYRGEFPDERGWIRMSGGNPVVGIDTAHGWQYLLEGSTNLTTFAPLGDAISGSNVVQESIITGPAPAREFFRWRIWRP